MIVFELACSAEHRFEGWFGSAEDFARQEAVGLLACPLCGTSEVRRLPSARIRTGTTPEPVPQKTRAAAPAAPGPVAEMTMASVLREILARSEDVGRRFPEEARRIHYEEIPPRPIRGQATPQEAKALAEEGVPVVALPIPPRSETH